MDYMDTIRRGFQLTWNNKFMWVLGFLAALGSGASFSNSNYSFNSGDFSALESWLTPERAAALTAGLIGFTCVAFIVGIILWLVSLGARGGLIAAVAQLETDSAKPTFGSAFRDGWKHVWRLVGMTIILFIIPFILIVILIASFLVPVTVSTLSFATSGAEDPTGLLAGFGGLAILFCCLLGAVILLTLVLSLIYPFAFRGIVLRGLGVIDSIKHGWRVLRDNLGDIILLGLAFFLIGIAILLLAAAILVPVGLVVGVPFALLGQADANFLQGLLAVLGILVGIIIMAAISAITTAWQSSTFTLAYLQWTGKHVVVEE
jgi:hypothetical protein